MNKCLLLIIILAMTHNSFAYEQISNLVTPVSYFVNHVKQLNSLKDNLSKYRQVSIVGTSGIGKTQLVRIYAYENKNKYNLIWFIDCNLDFNKEFVKLAKQLNQTTNANISEDDELAKKEVMNYLVHQDKWLIVFDNLKINENKKVQDLVDWEHNGNVIFCSQDSEILPHTIEMTTFNKEDAVTLASNLLENNDKNDIDFLVKAFSGYPILMVQGAQLLNKVKGLNKEEYKNKIYQSADKIKLNVALAIKELKPSAIKLLGKIALINTQRFSKQLVGVITDDSNTIEDDIYQLSKFMLIVNVNANENNPIFEMHDIIAQKVLEINQEDNKLLLEDIVLKINNSTKGLGTQNGHILRTESTMPENLEIILRNAEKYKINIYSVMELRKNLFVVYVNTQNKYGCEYLIDWFDEQEKNKKFNMFLMNEKHKGNYAAYLGLIGVYNQIILAHFETAIVYFNRALQILDGLEERINLKYNLTSHVAESQSFLGNIELAKVSIDKMEKLFDHGVDKADITLLHYAKSVMYLMQGKYIEALKHSDKDKEDSIKYGLSSNDLFMTVTYILRAEALNWLNKYHEAYVQTQQLYEMHKPVKRENHEIFGRIYTQMARSELGQGKVKKAFDHINKAITILLADERRNPKDADYSEDPDLAASYIVQGDVFFVQDNFKQAIESYKKAQIIYFYLYRDRSKNVAHVSYLYTQGAKVACRAKDLYNYKAFGKPQVKEFGVDHPNTIAMFEYCKQYNMDLWAKEN